jgi:FtsP/CotA-like multicopper oxidase with cupredoxin domain
MKTQTLHRIPTGLLLLGMIVTILFAMVYPQLAQASVLPSNTCSEAAGIRTCDLWATTGSLAILPGPVPAPVTVPIWGYADTSSGSAGLPGPTLIATAGETLVINLTNNLSEATSLSIRGLSGPSDTVGAAAGGGTKTYTYSGLQPGTYLYEAGPTANGERQIAMGMYGVLIVRPAGAPLEAYGPDSAFDDEAVLVMSEIDPLMNAAPTSFNLRNFAPKYFLFNGKAYPYTLPIDSGAGRKVLLRLVNGGLENHSVGVLGLRYSVLSIDGKPFAQPHSAVAETLSAGQTADVLVSIPASAPADMKYAVYDSNLRLINNGSSFGGMLTFLTIPAGPATGDVTGPSASGLSLSPNPSNGSVTVTFNASVSDSASGSNNIVAAEYFVDAAGSNGAGIAMAASDAAFDSPTELVTGAINPVSLTAGNHNIYIHGQDAAGNWGAFNFIAMNLDKQGPLTTSLQTTFQANGNVALSGSASDTTTGGGNIQAAEYFIDAAGANGAGAAMVVNQNAPTASITATIPAATVSTLTEGSHTLHVHSQDAFGNWGVFATKQLNVDKTGPAASVTLLSPSPNNGALPYSPSFQSVRLNAIFSEPGAGLVTSTVANAEFFIDTVGANGTGILMTPTDGLFNGVTESAYTYIPLVTVNALSQGNHVISIHGKDSAGNWGPLATTTLVIDKVPPVVSGLTLTPAASNNTAVAVSATANDTATGNSNIAAGEYFIDTAGTAGTGAAMTPGAASPNTTVSANIPAATIAGLTAGNHTVYVRAKDAAGNWGTTISATLLIDRTAPTFSGITLTPNSIAVGTATVQLNVNGSTDPLVSGLASGVAGGEYWFGATNITAGTGTAFSGLVTNIPTASLTAGTHTVRVRIRDVAGNWSTGVNGVRTATLTVTAPQPALYFSTFGTSNPPGVGGTADDADIYNYNGSAFSRAIDVTAAYSLPGGANVDGFDRVSATQFYMSFDGAVTIPLPGPDLAVQDEDVVYYNGTTWSLFFDGSVNGVGGADLDAISYVGGSLYFSTEDNTNPPGAGGSGDDADIYRWNGGSSYTRVFDASTSGFGGGTDVDGFVRVDATHFYVSFRDDTTVPVIGTVQDEDVVYNNAGVWSVYFDGTVLGLTSGNLDVDGFDLP